MGVLITSFAQEANQDNAFINKRGIALLPQAGDFALGIDATPFLEYLGNISGFRFNNAPVFKGVNNTIYFKYFLEDDRALRAKLHLNIGQEKYKQTVEDDHATITDPTNVDATTIDTWVKNTQNVGLDIGYEFRRGKGRVQGFYGGEIYLGYTAGNEFFEYGNPITGANTKPAFHEFAKYNLPKNAYRATERKPGQILSAGIGGFIGVEYFFTPQISMGGEFGLSYIYEIKGQDVIKGEAFIDSDVKEFSHRVRNANDRAFIMEGFTRTNAAISLIFHF